MKEINHTLTNPVQLQKRVFNSLFESLQDTKFGIEHGVSRFSQHSSLIEFKTKVPIREYDSFKPWIVRARKGEMNVVWPGKTKWFAKSSGTTSDRSKFLPVTEESLKMGHYKGGRDLLAVFCDQRPAARLYSGKHLIIGGSSALHEEDTGSYSGDLSAIIVRNLPPWVEMRRTPSRDITLLDDWKKKVKLMAEKVAEEDVRILAGIPSWMLVVCKEVLALKGVETLDEVWPNLWLYMHGGVGFGPYESEFKRLISSENMNYMETYNASEGFFALQDDLNRDDMALLLNHGIFYEFIPMREYSEESLASAKTHTLDEVVEGKDYAIVISTNAGLWRYSVGDVVKITCTSPFRIKIVGRTSSFLNVVGEELMIAQTEIALARTFEAFPHSLREFTVAPRFSSITGNPTGHHWIIECQASDLQQPDAALFAQKLDSCLCSLNSDYAAKRSADLILEQPLITFVRDGAFEVWLEKNNKLGGQHKIPRLSNSRKIIEEILVIPNL